MPEKITLDIDIADAHEYAELIEKKRVLLENDIKRQKAELEALLSKSAHLSEMLDKLNGVNSEPIHVDETVVGQVSQPKKPINGYNYKWSLWVKVQYILRKQIQPLSKNQIIDKLIDMEPYLGALVGKRKRAFSVSVSSCLTTKYNKGNGELKRVDSETDNFKYYLEMEQK